METLHTDVEITAISFQEYERHSCPGKGGGDLCYNVALLTQLESGEHQDSLSPESSPQGL